MRIALYALGCVEIQCLSMSNSTHILKQNLEKVIIRHWLIFMYKTFTVKCRTVEVNRDQ